MNTEQLEKEVGQELQSLCTLLAVVDGKIEVLKERREDLNRRARLMMAMRDYLRHAPVTKKKHRPKEA